MRNPSKLSVHLAGCLIVLASAPTLAGETIEASAATNPAPAEAFSGFDRFEVSSIAMSSPYAGQPANEQARKDLQADLDKRIQSWVGERHAQPAQHDPARTLLVEPRIDKVRFISTGARLWAGALSGTSRVLVKVKITDKATGAVIAEPEFYQQARGMAGAWTFGAADKAMLEREADLVVDYLRSNYEHAVGGTTGKP